MAAYDHFANRAELYGPFKRLQAAKGQSAETAVRQALGGEVWGEVPRYGITPAVEAYPGRLRAGETGIEFWAFARPDVRYGPRPRWFRPSQFVRLETEEDRDVAKLKVAFVRITQDLLVADRPSEP